MHSSIKCDKSSFDWYEYGDPKLINLTVVKRIRHQVQFRLKSNVVNIHN